MIESTISMVVLPKREWESIKNAVNEMKSLLEGKASLEASEEWIESAKARKMLGVSPKTWQTYRDNRLISFAQFGRKIMVKKADLQAFLDANYISRKEVV